MLVYFLYNDLHRIAVTEVFECDNCYVVPVNNSFSVDVYPKSTFKIEIKKCSQIKQKE
jgi:hypothetical protein